PFPPRKILDKHNKPESRLLNPKPSPLIGKEWNSSADRKAIKTFLVRSASSSGPLRSTYHTRTMEWLACSMHKLIGKNISPKFLAKPRLLLSKALSRLRPFLRGWRGTSASVSPKLNSENCGKKRPTWRRNQVL